MKILTGAQILGTSLPGRLNILRGCLIFTAFVSLHVKKSVISYAPSRKVQTTAKLTGHSRTAGPLY